MEEKVNWRGPEHFHIEKKTDWYLAVGIISVAIIISAILVANYIFALLVALATVTLMMFASRGPRMVDIEVNHSGITFGEFFYPYESLKSYDIEELPELRILIKTQRFLMPVVIIPAHDANIGKIDEILSQYLEVEDLQESPIHKLFEYLGF
jgi:uncharacterized membrane protein YobD (UPF0266 family)